MLSYRHGYHAGNFADVLKHAVWLHVLQHLTRKEKGFLVVDTHAGAGEYDLASEHARKLEEHRYGVGRIETTPNAPPMVDRYLAAVRSHRDRVGASHYPGSFALTLATRRPQDRCVAYELHPTDFAALQRFVRGEREVACLREDGLAGLLAHVPPKERRGAVLIDPPYELEEEYRRVPEAIAKAHRKFATGTYVLWYPVVRRAWTQGMLNRIVGSGIRKILALELALRPDDDLHGMTASGMVVINPPFTLEAEGATALDWLAQTLNGTARCEWLVPE